MFIPTQIVILLENCLTICSLISCYRSRPVENIRGFSRETVIEITSNIESQEYRRREIIDIGYPEHLRAGGTDDLETFFGIDHRNIGTVFTLKQFKEYWPSAVR